MAEKIQERLPEAIKFGKTMLDYMLERARGFDIIDWAMFKLCLVSLGVLIGSTFSSLCKKMRPLITALFFLGWIYMAWRLFFCEEDE